MFHYDSALVHIMSFMKTWFAKGYAEETEWPTQNPVLNPTDHLGDRSRYNGGLNMDVLKEYRV